MGAFEESSSEEIASLISLWRWKGGWARRPELGEPYGAKHGKRYQEGIAEIFARGD